MLRWHLWQRIVVILTIHSHSNSVLAIPPIADVSPVSRTVFVNDTVEFQCQITDTGDYQRLIWISDYDSTDEVVHYIAAEESTDVDTSGEGHGNYSVDYYASLDEFGEYTVHHLTLRIEGVMLPDEGQYACGYLVYFTDQFGRVVDEQVRFLGDKANLTILEPPHAVNPSCTFIPDPLTLSSVMVTMTCQINGGRPLPSLTWYKKDTVLSQASELNVLHYELSPEDNGVEFMCIASGPALVVDGSCSVVPQQINPSVFITSSVHMPTHGSADVKLTCEGSGIPMISKLDWLYNGQALPNTNNMELKYQIVDISDSLSELHVFNVQYGHNDVVTCYVEIPSGLNSQRSVTIMVTPDQTTAISITSDPTFSTHSFDVTSYFTKTVQPKSSANFTSGFIVPLAAVFGGLIVILVAAILTTIVCRRKHQMKRANSQAPIVIDRQRRNMYQLDEIITKRNAESAVSDSPDDAYVISELPGTRTATVVSDPPYDQLNPQSAPNTDNSYDQLNPQSAPNTDNSYDQLNPQSA